MFNKLKNKILGYMNWRISRYYECHNDIDKQLKYLHQSIIYGDSYAANDLGIFYENRNQMDNMLSYYILGSSYGNSCATFNLGRYYEKHKQINQMISCYTVAAKQQHRQATINLIDYYYANQKYDLMYKLIIESKCVTQSERNTVLGGYYRKINDIPKMLHHFELAITKKYIPAMIHLGNYYESNNQPDQVIKYYTMAGVNGQQLGYYELGRYYQENGYSPDKFIECFTKASMNFPHYNSILKLGIYYQSIREESKMLAEYLTILNAQITKESENYSVFQKIREMAYSNINDYFSSNYNIIKILPYYDYFNKWNKSVLNKLIETYVKIKTNYADQIKYHLIQPIEECFICLNNSGLQYAEHLLFTCDRSNHHVCFKCYQKINKCPFCRQESIEINREIAIYLEVKYALNNNDYEKYIDVTI